MGPLAALIGRSGDRYVRRHHPIVDADTMQSMIKAENGLTSDDFDKGDRQEEESSTYQYGGASSSWSKH